MNFRRYLLRKAVYVIITIFFIASLNFLLFQVIAGDPTYVLLPRGCGTSNVTGECPLRAQLIHEWALDQPLIVRFVTYLRNVFSGNLGTSITYQTGVPVATIIAPRLSPTFIITNVAWFSLTLRNSLTDVLPEDYMITARAKGLSQGQQLRWHALPNARLPLVTASALYFGWVVSGAIVIEIVFTIQGLGQLTWEATTSFDFPLLSAIFLIATIGVVVANAVADVLYMFLDPRVREA